MLVLYYLPKRVSFFFLAKNNLHRLELTKWLAKKEFQQRLNVIVT